MGLNSVPAITDEIVTAEVADTSSQATDTLNEPEQSRVAMKSAAKINSPALFGGDEKDASVTEVLVQVSASTVLDGPLLTREEKRLTLLAMNENEVSGCTKCRLCETRTHTVFGEGDVDAKIFFIGEGPGETEDQTGRPFVGRAGELLNKMIAGMGLKREQVFIANIVKCRPPNNRVPAPDEVATCTPYLTRQLGDHSPARSSRSACRRHSTCLKPSCRWAGCAAMAQLARHQTHADLPSRLRVAQPDLRDTSGSMERSQTSIGASSDLPVPKKIFELFVVLSPLSYVLCYSHLRIEISVTRRNKN